MSTFLMPPAKSSSSVPNNRISYSHSILFVPICSFDLPRNDPQRPQHRQVRFFGGVECGCVADMFICGKSRWSMIFESKVDRIRKKLIPVIQFFGSLILREFPNVPGLIYCVCNTTSIGGIATGTAKRVPPPVVHERDNHKHVHHQLVNVETGMKTTKQEYLMGDVHMEE